MSVTTLTQTKLSKPITTDQLLQRLLNKECRVISGLGVNSDGTVLLVEDAPVPGPRVRGKPGPMLPGEQHAYTVIDLPTATGGFSISNFPSFFLSALYTGSSLLKLTGNQTFTFNSNGAWIIKSAVIVTDSNVATRSLILTASGVLFHPSTKTATASLTVDLLDREVVFSAAPGSPQVLSIENNKAGDVLQVSFIQVG